MLVKRLLYTAAVLFAAHAFAADDSHASIAKMQDTALKSAEREIVSLAEAMPADKYKFAPTEGEFKGVRTFGQQMSHIAAVNYLMAAAILGEKGLIDMQRYGAIRLRNEIHGAQPQRLQGHLGIPAGERRDHHHRTRTLHHDPAQAGNAVHLRQCSHPAKSHRARSFSPAPAPPRHGGQAIFQIALVPENVGQTFAHQRGIVGDKNFDHKQALFFL